VQQSETHELTDFLANSPGARRCPDVPAAPNAVAAAPSAGSPESIRTYVAEARHRLPKPEPKIQPGRAITGKEAFLELGDGTGSQTISLTDPVGAGDVRIEATPKYTVDWGDGTTTETSSAGGPWPKGDVRHVYEKIGHYDVVVTAGAPPPARAATSTGSPPKDASTRFPSRRYRQSASDSVRTHES
jgi:hypothetical protein